MGPLQGHNRPQAVTSLGGPAWPAFTGFTEVGIRAGTVWINCHNVFDAALPFGGYKESGWGREMGEFVLNNYTEVKAATTAL